MEHVERVANLLNTTKNIIHEHESQYNNAEHQFNIFRITNMSYKEVHICQVIKELIDPHGSHYQGDIYFRLFAKYVLKIDDLLNEHDYTNISVVAEQVISNDRRIDLYIEIGNKFSIPIEVKIWASDLDEQCYDYFEYASKRNKDNTKLYYLTLDGRKPAANSTEGLSKNNICLISFKDEILTWLNACISDIETQKISSVYEIMLQLIDVLKEITGQNEVDIEMKIKELINDKDTYKSAVLLRKTVSQIDNELRHDILNEINNRIKQKYNLDKITNAYDFESVSERSKGYQGCCYKLGETEVQDYTVALRITFGTYLYSEICLLKNNEIYWDDVSKVLDSNSVVENPDNIFKSSFNWKYFIADKNNRPCFDTPNDAYFSLIEKDKFQEYINAVMDDLDIFLLTLAERYRPTKNQ